jgi:hypothetical protein
MQYRPVVFISILFISSFLLLSCATTTLTSVWKESSLKAGKIKKILIIGVSDKPAIRRFYEDEFVKQFQLRGLDAVASYTIVETEKVPEKEFFLSKIQDLGIDAIMITRLVDRKTVETYYPPEVLQSGQPVPPPGLYPRGYYLSWYGYYYDCYQCVRTPGYTVQDEIVSLETNMYDSRTDKLIWSALSDTFVGTLEGGVDTSTIKSFIQVIINRLSADNMI